MNPQYMPQQGPPPFQQRPSPSLTPQGYQNLPLGPPKQTTMTQVSNGQQMGAPPQFTTSHYQTAAPPQSQFGPTSQPPQQQQAVRPALIPQGQLPPPIKPQPDAMPQSQLPPQFAPKPHDKFQNGPPPPGPQLTKPLSAMNGANLFPNQAGPPKPGNQFGAPAPPESQFSQPRLNQPNVNNFGQPPPISQPQFNQPPPGQFNQPNQFSRMPPNQLSNQMQGMNIGGPKPMDNGPHMPPPISQQNYMNGPQIRSPSYPGQPPMGALPPMPGQPMPQPPFQMGGQPPMPGQPHIGHTPMPGQPHMPGHMGVHPPMPGQPMMPGQPPMPGQTMPSGPYPSQGGFQQQQQRRLDPDQMPSPIQVTQDDQKTRSGMFCTNTKGLVPPLVSTNFEVVDQGNASPRFIRSTMYNVPITQDLMKQTAVPFGLVISPMARMEGQEFPPPIVNFGDLGPVRCIRCKAYMCPFMQFIDSGRRFQCLFCKAATDVPSEYFQHLDHTGQRMDRYERPELILGTYEFTATTEYCRNNALPKPPAIIFVIDVSYNNVKSGLVHLLCSQMKEIIKNLPVDQGMERSNMKVGFITYNNTVHFYNIKGTLAAPQMLVVGDVQEMFMPLLDGFLCTPEESDDVIDALMQQIPAMFGDTRETETILLPAILGGLEALKASECTGKLLVFHSSLPIAEAPGKLKNRDDRKLLGTDKERTVLTPQTQAYNQLGQDCVASGCCVDLFLFNNAYIDVATIGQVSRLTGGEIYKYTYFQADIDGDRLVQDIVTDISRPIAFDSVMRVRTSTGIRATDFYGHFFMSNTTDMEIAAIDCDKAVAVEIKHDDKLTEEDGVYLQVALLYTSCSGQRRLRIINLSLKTCSQMADLYRSCDLDTIINFFGKQSVYKLLENNPKAVKDSIVTRSAQILANYRKNCASPSSAGQLILPECMKLLPLYVNCLLKSDALSGGSDITLDDRSFMMHVVLTMDIPSSVSYFYPRLIPLNEIQPDEDGSVEIPPPIRTTVEKMSDQGVYLLENGIHMFLYIGLAANPEFVHQVFGVPTAVQIDIDKYYLPELDNPTSIAVRSVIDQVRLQRHRCMRLTLIRQREKLESVFKHFLVEDRGMDGSPSYVDFLCHMHKEIRQILS